LDNKLECPLKIISSLQIEELYSLAMVYHHELCEIIPFYKSTLLQFITNYTIKLNLGSIDGTHQIQRLMCSEWCWNLTQI